MTDLKVGDLVKATRRDDAETKVEGRVIAVNAAWVDFQSLCIQRRMYDYEVLDRPLPPVSDELVRACRDAYVGVTGNSIPVVYHDNWVKVINTVREYDRKNNTEESK